MTTANRRPHRRAVAALRVTAAAAAALGGTAARTRADTFTWTAGHPTTGFFDLPQNWNRTSGTTVTADVAPPNDGSADLVFPACGKAYAPTDEVGYNVSSVTFTADASVPAAGGGQAGYLLAAQNGVALGIGSGGLADAAPIPQTVLAPLALRTTQTWTVSNGAGLLNASGGATINANRLTVAGAGSTAITGLTGTGQLDKVGTGTLTLVGPSPFTGGTTVQGGTLTVAGGTVGSATADVTIANTNTYPNPAALTLTAPSATLACHNLLVGSNPAGSATQSAGTVTAAGIVYVGVNDGTGTYFLTGGSIVAGQLIVGGVSSVGVLNQTGGTVTASAGTQVDSVGTYNLSGGGVLATPSVTTVNGTGTLNLNGGTLRATADATAFVAVTAANLFGGGVTIDAQGYNVTVGQALLAATGAGGNGGVTKLGSGTLTLSGSNTYLGGTTLAAGTVAVASAGALGPSGPITFAGGTLQYTSGNAVDYSARLAAAAGQDYAIDTDGQSVTFATPLGGTGSLSKLGAGTLTLAAAETFPGETVVAAGTLQLARPGSLAGPLLVVSHAAAVVDAAAAGGINRATVGPITVTAGGAVTLVPAAASADRTLLVTPSVTLVGTGRLDVGNDDLDLTRTTVAAVTALAASGFDGGTWTGGGGLDSAAAATDATHLTAVGVILNGSTYATFDGQPVSATDVLVRYTYYGDTNLDGVVNAADYTRVDAGFVNHLTGWINGDFNYDGVVDGTDYALMDNAFNQQVGAVSPSLAVASDLAASPAAAVASAAVPEPTTAGLLAVAAAGLVGRRRRRPG